MATNSVKDYTFSKPTENLQRLSLKAAVEIGEEAVAAKEKPVSKLTYSPSCREITLEYLTTHHKISSIAIERNYKPEVFAHIDGPLWIKPLHTAVVIPILKLGASTVTLTSRAGVKYDVVWQPGSIHFLGEDVSLDIAGDGRVVFVFLLFEMKERGSGISDS